MWAPSSPLLPPAMATTFHWPLLLAGCLPHAALCKPPGILTRKMALAPEVHAPGVPQSVALQPGAVQQAHLGHLLKCTLPGPLRASEPGLGTQRTDVSDNP